MCGICGIYNFSQKVDINQTLLKKMTDVMVHRGPDDEGFYLGGEDKGIKKIGLGHRRLAVIDLKTGHQPMSNEDKSCWIVYNGEIYNYRELKSDLEQKGHRFRSSSDTEVILHLYEQWGEKCLDYLNGIFAFAIWDEKAKRLFMARDRFGTKPLYYYNDKDNFIFASDIKAILAIGLVKVELDHRAMKEYFTFQNIYSDLTLFKSIKTIPTATFVVIHGQKIKMQKYWDISFNNQYDKGEKYYVEQLRDILPRVVKRQLISDVPLGSFLSGGMDSSTLVVLADRYLSPLTTFTCGFNMNSVSGLELGFDERREAEELIQDISIRHYDVILHAGDMQRVLPKLVWYLEDLRLGMSYSNYYVAELASKFVKVVLSGAGGDEIFAGYPWRYEIVLGAAPGEFEDIYFKYWQRLILEVQEKDFFTANIHKEIQDYDLFEIFKNVLKNCQNDDSLNKALYFETKTFLSGLLIVDDKISMASSLEERVPFLDNELVDFMQTVPARYKFGEKGSKYLLKKAMTGILPDFVLNRPKQGFSAPDHSWYKGPTMGYIKEILLSEKMKQRGLFNPNYVQEVIEQHLSGKVNYRLLIWSLLCFEWWCRIFLDGEEVMGESYNRI